jgi:hypothetical protein
VLAPPCRCPRFGLVSVERVDRAYLERSADARVQAVGQRHSAWFALGLGGEVCKLLADEEVVPELRAYGHRPIVALASRRAAVATLARNRGALQG